MPFSSKPIVFGSYMALNIDDYEKAFKFTKAGLIANPDDPVIINNLCYSLAMNNQITQAEKN